MDRGAGQMGEECSLFLHILQCRHLYSALVTQLNLYPGLWGDGADAMMLFNLDLNRASNFELGDKSRHYVSLCDKILDSLAWRRIKSIN